MNPYTAMIQQRPDGQCDILIYHKGRLSDCQTRLSQAEALEFLEMCGEAPELLAVLDENGREMEYDLRNQSYI